MQILRLFLFSRFVKFVKLIFGGKSVNIPLEKVNARTERFFWGGAMTKKV